MAKICCVDIYIEVSDQDIPDTKIVKKYTFQTVDVNFFQINRVIDAIFTENFCLRVFTKSYVSMKANIHSSLVFDKDLSIRVSDVDHLVENVEAIHDIKTLQRVLRKIHCKILSNKKLTRMDYLSFYILKFASIIKVMRDDILNSHKMIPNYVAAIRTIDFLKKCNPSRFDDCVDIFYRNKNREIEKVALLKEFLDIRKNRREEIEYYLDEERRCVQKKIIC